MRRWRRRDWFRVQVVAAFAICGAAIAFAAPNLARNTASWPSWLPNQKMPLGMDIAGGTMLLLEPDWRPIDDNALHELRTEVRRVLREEKIRYDNLRIAFGQVRLELVDRADADRVSNLLAMRARDWYPMPLQSLPSVAVRVTGLEVSVAMTVAGRSGLRETSLSSAVHRLHRQMRCHGTDYSLRQDGHRVWVVVRHGEPLEFRSSRCYHV